MSKSAVTKPAFRLSRLCIVSIFSAVTFALCGCAGPKYTRFEELPAGSSIDRSPPNARYAADGEILTITPLDQRGVWLANVDVRVMEGDVYLYPINISSVGPRTISVDFSDPKFPRDWKKRLYWIQNITGLPLLSKERILYRKKITVD